MTMSPYCHVLVRTLSSNVKQTLCGYSVSAMTTALRLSFLTYTWHRYSEGGRKTTYVWPKPTQTDVWASCLKLVRNAEVKVMDFETGVGKPAQPQRICLVKHGGWWEICNKGVSGPKQGCSRHTVHRDHFATRMPRWTEQQSERRDRLTNLWHRLKRSDWAEPASFFVSFFFTLFFDGGTTSLRRPFYNQGTGEGHKLLNTNKKK